MDLFAVNLTKEDYVVYEVSMDLSWSWMTLGKSSVFILFSS